jgi:hypothetical protein
MRDHVGSPIAIYNIFRQFLFAWRTNDICDSSVNIWQDTDLCLCMLTTNKLLTINKPTEILHESDTIGLEKDINRYRFLIF